MSMFESQSALGFPQPLSEKYRPRKINDFIGLVKERKIVSAFCRAPRESAFLFVGPSGLGKTTLALAMAEELGAELHLISSQKCTVENLEDVMRSCQYVPLSGGFHFVLVDEVDSITDRAQLALLSRLDSTARPPKTVFVFTSNNLDKLEKRFLSRCLVLEFSSYGLRSELAQFLADIWKRETGKESGPDFERMAKDSTNNCRDALMKLELAIMEVQ